MGLKNAFINFRIKQIILAQFNSNDPVLRVLQDYNQSKILMPKADILDGAS